MIRGVRRTDFPALRRISQGLFERYNDPDFPVSDASCAQAFEAFANMRYFRVMELEGEVVGWMVAHEGAGMHHSDVRALTQLYYHSELTGIRAARALVEFHEHLFQYAERLGYEVAVTSSILPSSEVFSRLLERAGWRRGSRFLTRRTRHHRLQAGCPETRPRARSLAQGSRAPSGSPCGQPA